MPLSDNYAVLSSAVRIANSGKFSYETRLQAIVDLIARTFPLHSVAIYLVDEERRYLTRKITDIAGQITSGKITAFPYRLSPDLACKQCEYKPVCRFDWQINNYNLLTRVNKEQVLDLIKSADESK